MSPKTQKKTLCCKQSCDFQDHLQTIFEVGIKHPQKLRQFLRRYEKNDEAIDDLISDSLLEAVKSMHRYSEKSSVETWFFGICRNVARRHVAQSTTKSFIAACDDLDEVLATLVEDSAKTPEQLLSTKELIQQTASIVSTFNPGLRATFELACIENMSYLDVSQELQIPVGTVRSRVNKARCLLSTLAH